MINRENIVKILIEYRKNYKEDSFSLCNACKEVLNKENILEEFITLKDIIDTDKEVLLLKEVGVDKEDLIHKSYLKHRAAKDKYIKQFRGKFVDCYREF